jgi:hypothetical protein
MNPLKKIKGSDARVGFETLAKFQVISQMRSEGKMWRMLNRKK